MSVTPHSAHALEGVAENGGRRFGEILLLIYRATRRHILEDSCLHNIRPEYILACYL